MEYLINTQAGSGPVRHTLADGYLTVEWEKSGRRESVPLAGVTKLQLTREFQGIFRLKIARNHGKTLSIPSRHFVAMGRFEDRGDEYGELVRQLHAGCHAANPDVVLVSGSTLMYWMGWLFVALGTVLVAGMAFGWMIGMDNPPWRSLWMLPILYAVGTSFVVQGRTKRHEADAIPPKFLPGG